MNVSSLLMFGSLILFEFLYQKMNLNLYWPLVLQFA